MRRLFSPWRSSYVSSFNEEKKKTGCLFCAMKREKKDERNLIVTRGKHCFVVMNLYPYNSGHLLIVPYVHTKEMSSLKEETLSEVFALTIKVQRALHTLAKPHGYNFGANIGRVAGAGIEQHIHFHLVPRWNGDTNFLPVLADTKIISEDLKEQHRKLSQLLSS